MKRIKVINFSKYYERLNENERIKLWSIYDTYTNNFVISNNEPELKQIDFTLNNWFIYDNVVNNRYCRCIHKKAIDSCFSKNDLSSDGFINFGEHWYREV